MRYERSWRLWTCVEGRFHFTDSTMIPRWLYYFEWYMWYVLLALEIPGNILSAIVWLRRHVTSKNSSAVYLAALAIDDLAYLLTDTIDFQCVDGWFCESVYYLSGSAANFESLLVLGFSVERLIAILRPLQVCCTGWSKERGRCTFLLVSFKRLDQI